MGRHRFAASALVALAILATFPAQGQIILQSSSSGSLQKDVFASGWGITADSSCMGIEAFSNERTTDGVTDPTKLCVGFLATTSYSYWPGTCVFHYRGTLWSGALVFPINHTAEGGEFPAAGMTDHNWTAKIHGVLFNQAGAQANTYQLQFGCYSVPDENEAGRDRPAIF